MYNAASMQDHRAVFPVRLHTFQLTYGSLLAAISVFGLVIYSVVTFVTEGVGVAPEANMLFTKLFAVIALAAIPLGLLLPRNIVNNRLRELATEDSATYEESMWSLMWTKTYVFLGLLEGAAIITGIAYLLEGQLLSLVIFGAAVAIMAGNVPTQLSVSKTFSDWRQMIDSVKQELQQ